MAKEWSTLRDVLQTRKVTKNQCCNSLLDYLFSTTSKPLFDKMVAVTKEYRKNHDDEPPKKKEDPECFSIPVTIKGFYVGEMMHDLRSNSNMMSLSLSNKIGGLELNPSKIRTRLADGSLKIVEGVTETVNIDIDGFTFSIEVLVMEMRGFDRVQMILWRPFLATAQSIINVNQGEIIIRSGEKYITYKVSRQYR